MNGQFNPMGTSARNRLRLASPPPPLPGEGEIDWLQLARLVRRRLGSIVVLTALMTGATLPVILGLPAEYAAHTRVILSQPMPATLTDPADPGARTMDVNEELERMTGRATAEAVIATLDLTANPDFAPDPRPGLRERLGLAPIAPPVDPQEAALDRFAEGLTVRRAGTSAVAEVGFTAADPALAADVANQTVRSYAAVRESQQQSQIAETRAWLDTQIAEQLARHDAARARAQAYQSEHNLAVNTAASGAMQAVQALTTAGDRLAQERADISSALAMIGQAGDFPATPVPGEPAALTALRTDFQRQQREVEQFQTLYGQEYGGVAQARDQAELTRTQIQRQTEAYGSALQARLEGVQRETQNVETQLQQAQGGLARQSVAEMELAGLLRAAEAEAQALAALERRQRALDAGGTIPAVQVEVLSPAMPPVAAEGYGTKAYVALALIISACLAMTLVALREMLDRSARSHDQFAHLPEVVPVGTLPATPRGDLATVMQRRPPGPFADAVQGMVMAIEAASGGSLPRSLMVTSPGTQEGRSTVVAALALALAATGQRVLVVDLNGDEPRITEPRVEDGSRRAVRPDALAGIETLAGLRRAGTPRDRIADILDHGARTDSLVLFDAPPVLSSALATQLAGLAERRMLVIRWGRTPRRMAEAAAERLFAAGGDRVMTVMSGVDPRRHALYGFRDSLPAMGPRRPAGRDAAYGAAE